MPKPPVRRIPADTCIVSIGDVEYTPHEGEWVEVIGSPSIAENGEFDAMLRIAGERTEARDSKLPDKEKNAKLEELSQEFDRHFDQFCARLGESVVSWNLTDDRGRDIPQPDGTEAPIRALRTEEVYFLWKAYRGAVKTDRKNGLNGSGRSSTARDRSPSKR